MSAHSSSKAIYSALAANTGIAISKFVVAVITTSSTMMAEAVHSSADCFNQVLLLIGKKRSAKEADENHSFGYGKENFFWSVIVAVVLFALGSVFSIVEGIHKTMHPEAVKNAIWIFGLLIVAAGLEAGAFWTALKEFRKTNKGTFLKALQRSTDTDLIVILIEDSGAMLGLSIAFVFTAMAVFINPIFDGIGSVVVGTLLGYMSYFLANELRKLIIGENISREIRNHIKSMIKEWDVVDHINNIRAMYVGNNKFLLNLSIDVNDDTRAGDIESIIFDMKNYIRKEYPDAEYINIEIAKAQEA